jgi:hypothetical protein
MFAAPSRMSSGPLAPFMGRSSGPDMQAYFQRGGNALMHQANEIEQWMEENTAAVCIAGLVLGTFVDRRFLLLPLALGGIKLWRSLQSS